ncbi:MAG: hypothetical protein NXI00_11110 [Cytophagales bacterium]|nr:hypothetical protein [Cytophagales bacterium]
MNLEILNTQNCQTVRSGEPRVRLNLKSGTVTINSIGADKIGFKPSQGVLFYYDKEENQHYISIASGNTAFVPRTDSSKRNYIFNNSALVKTIAKRHNAEENFNLIIGKESDEHTGLFPLLYAKPR